MPPPIVDAVTALLMVKGELFMVRRSPQMPSFAGFHAFPGGKVDAADTDEPLPQPLLSAQQPRLLRALDRELREELALDLFAAADAGTLISLRLAGIALTPPITPVRFNTHFYVVELAQRPSIELDTREASEGSWATPAQWLARYQLGEMLLAPPTLNTLQALAAGGSDVAMGPLGIQYRPDVIVCTQHIYGLPAFHVPSNTLPPASHTASFLIGQDSAHCVLVDPSPRSPLELDQLCTALAGKRVDEVFLTHSHPDHREYADALARRLGVRLGMSAATEAALRHRAGPDFFEGLDVHRYYDGDLVSHWLGQPVRAIAVPGHDEGHLALMPDNRAWCIVGDLFQGIGTVVIAKPEGDMRKYFASLQRIIDLAPLVVIPSHGTPCGGTFRLEQTLLHRRQREQQVLALYQEGHAIDDMLEKIYQGLDPRLMPMARLNIESHLDKLKEEGILA